MQHQNFHNAVLMDLGEMAAFCGPPKKQQLAQIPIEHLIMRFLATI